MHSADTKVDCVGACVGVRGTRIKSIIDELHGERIDIIRWNEDAEALITNALKPADISHIELEAGTKKALVLVDEDQLSLAIGRRGQNVRLASRLTGWDIDIMTRAELEQSLAEPDQVVEVLVDDDGNPVLDDNGNPMDVDGNPIDPALLEAAREVEVAESAEGSDDSADESGIPSDDVQPSTGGEATISPSESAALESDPSPSLSADTAEPEGSTPDDASAESERTE